MILNVCLEDFFAKGIESVYLPEKRHYQRFSTIYEIGFKGTYTGDYAGPDIYSLILREQYYPIKQMLFCNLLIYVPNALFDQNLTREAHQKIRLAGMSYSFAGE